jgi:LysM repeat protein
LANKLPAPAPAAPKPLPAAEAAPSSSGKVHVVAKGDNPYSIAKKFQVTQASLMKANNIDDPRKLQIGQKLVIP